MSSANQSNPAPEAEETSRPDLANGPTQTDETDETNFPTSNAQFLNAIFANLEEPLRPMVLRFAGNPAVRKAWGGTSYRSTSPEPEDVSQNWYFTLGVYRPAEDGYHRREKDCAVLYGVMLDDVGTKALPLERLSACPPTYVIETSAGNFQAGYLFDTPLTEFASATALNQRMVEAGLCDPGAKSPTTRYGRLPFASNGKSSPAFTCRLIAWNPERRYSVEQIAKRLELAPLQEKSTSKPTHPGSPINQNSLDGIYTPRSSENEVIRKLKERGLYKQVLGDGKHDVTCPWLQEHTDQVDHGSAYFEPSTQHPVGGYKCQHAHGSHLRIGALLKFLGVTLVEAKHQPSILTEPGNIVGIAQAAERELALTQRYYQRGGLIVEIVTDPGSDETTIRPMSQPALLRALSSVAIWEKFDMRSDSYVVIDPPDRHVAILFGASSYTELPALAGIARQPHLRRDGSLVRDAGFDPSTGLFGVFDTGAFTVPEQPSLAQAHAALEELRALLREVTFKDAHDESTTLAGILTAAIRPSIETAPMFHVRAPTIAAGKSYLTGLIAAFASATSPAAMAFPTTEEECAKLLLSTLMAAPGTVVFDNMSTDILPLRSLCSVITEQYLTGRILGVSKTATVGTRALLLSSGNNVGPVGDMARRCLTVALDPLIETPATRQFQFDPLTQLRARRPHYVSLALTIIRAHIHAGSPSTKCQALASFNQWSHWVRQPLLWLGLPDPAGSIFEQLAHDPDREVLGRLLQAWKQEFGNSPTMIRQLLERVQTGVQVDNLREALRDVAEERGEINRRRLGRWIARHAGRIVDGYKFERAAGNTTSERWMVVATQSVTSVTSVSNPPLAETVSEDSEVF